MENNPEAAPAEPQVVAPAATEAQPTTSTEQTAPVANIPAEQVEAFNRFIAANGGFDKAFAKLKTDISAPAAKTEPAQGQVAQPVQAQQPAQPQPTRVPDGYITQEEFAVKQYFEGLSRNPEYSSIAEQIYNGDIMKEMQKFNIMPMQNGAINDRQIRQFLDLYSKTVPATASSAPVTTTPTVDYVSVGETITNRDDAMRILQQNQTLGAQGLAEHPQTQAAKDFLRNYFKK